MPANMPRRKQPNQEQLVQLAPAWKQEADFFANTEPWKAELTDLEDWSFAADEL